MSKFVFSLMLFAVVLAASCDIFITSGGEQSADSDDSTEEVTTGASVTIELADFDSTSIEAAVINEARWDSHISINLTDHEQYDSIEWRLNGISSEEAAFDSYRDNTFMFQGMFEVFRPSEILPPGSHTVSAFVVLDGVPDALTISFHLVYQEDEA